MDIQDLLYNRDSESLPSQGSLLIADPLMAEDYFSRAVIMILDVPASGGQLGLVLNKQTKLTLGNLMPDWDGGENIPVFSGGPVDMERLFLLHTLGDLFPGAMEVASGLYVGGNVDDITDYIDRGGKVSGRLRFFLGYCGWSPGQLKEEIERHSWAVNTNPDGKSLLRGRGIEYWRREVSNLGESYRSWLMVPPDPSYN